MKMFQDIADFHAKFGLAYDGPPRRLPAELGPFRVGFMAEELAEYISPSDFDHTQVATLIKSFYSVMGDQVSLEKQMDALVDLVYVALGTAYLHGFDFDEAWRRVHEANMRKIRAEKKEDSLRGSTFDVVKPPGWTAPDLLDLVQPSHEEGANKHERNARRGTKMAILTALLREARQYVSDAGCDDGETHQISNLLLQAIDTALQESPVPSHVFIRPEQDEDFAP